MKLPYIKVYTDFIDIVRALDNGARGRLFLAVMQYANGEEPDELTGAEKIAFLTIKNQIDRDRTAYMDISEKRRQSGTLGGRPKRSTEVKANGFSEKQKKQMVFEKSKKSKCLQDKEKDKDKEEDKDKDKEKEKNNIPPKSPQGDRAEKGSEFADYAGSNQELLEALQEYEQMRKTIHAPMTSRARVLLVGKLDRLCEGIRDKNRYRLECLEAATLNNWKSVYALKEFVDSEPEPFAPAYVPPESDTLQPVIDENTTLEDLLSDDIYGAARREPSPEWQARQRQVRGETGWHGA